MNKTSIVALLLTAAVTLLACSDPTGPQVVGEVIVVELTTFGPDGTPMGDGVIFPEAETIDFPGIVMEREAKTIEVRGAAWAQCPRRPVGVFELDGDQLTVSITEPEPAPGSICLDELVPFAFQATTSHLGSGSYDVRVLYRGLDGHEDGAVVFTGTAEID